MAHFPFHAFIDQANPSTNDDHIPDRDHPEELNPHNQGIMEQSEQEIPMISHVAEHVDVLKQ